MHQAFYRKWRPETFDDVCGQEHITSILRYEAENRTFNHAYLFCGSRGTGKTTCAKILAKVINCESPVSGNPCGKCAACMAIDSGAATDVLEMDAASNNSVDNIRDIRDEVVYSPSSLRFRVYIIDEVHMLSVSAFNALLKTLEEPPAHVVFILATTELQKLPATIISRCQRFDFRRISTDAIVSRLSYIAKEEGITLHEDAARMLARLAQGGMRDAISLLDLCAGTKKEVDLSTVENTVGLTGREAMLKTVNSIADRDFDALFSQIAEVVRSSKDLSVFWQDLISLYRDILVVKSTKNAEAYLDLTEAEYEQLSAVAARFQKESLLYHCKLLEDALFAMQKANAVKRVVAELTLVRLCDETLDTSPEALTMRVAQLEERLLSGAVAPVSKVAQDKPQKAPVKAQPQPKEAPKPQAAETKAPVAPAQSTAKPTSPSTDGVRRLRPLRNWMEVAERMGRSNPMLASFVRSAKAYSTEDGCVIVQFDNVFSMSRLEQSDERDRLRAALSTVLRREVGDRQLILEIVTQKDDRTVIDEILDAVDEEA